MGSGAKRLEKLIASGCLFFFFFFFPFSLLLFSFSLFFPFLFFFPEGGIRFVGEGGGGGGRYVVSEWVV